MFLDTVFLLQKFNSIVQIFRGNDTDCLDDDKLYVLAKTCEL